MSNREHEEEIAANRRRRLGPQAVFPVVRCPGCDAAVTPRNAGGYRTFCEPCVDVFPALPNGSGAYVIEGRFPSFTWVAADEGGTRAVPEFEVDESLGF